MPKITIDLYISNVDSLLEEDTRLGRYSQVVPSQNLQWYGRVKVRKPGPNPTTGNNNNKNKGVVDNKAYLSCILYCHSPIFVFRNWKCKTDYKVTLVRLRSNFSEDYSRQGSYEFENFTNSRGWGFPKFIGMDDFLKGDYVKDNQALIRIEVEPGVAFGLPILVGGALGTTSVGTSLSRLTWAFGKSSSVVTFVTKDGGRVKANSSFLMKGSPVFSAMFASSAIDEDVVLPDTMTHDCLYAMLDYIYGAPLFKLDQRCLSLIQGLVPAAHDFELPELKKYCGRLLLRSANAENVLEFYKLAEKYGLEGVRKEMEEFIRGRKGLDQSVLDPQSESDDGDDV